MEYFPNLKELLLCNSINMIRQQPYKGHIGIESQPQTECALSR